MKQIDDNLLNQVLAESRKSLRKRAHYNLHPNLSDPVQRFLNVMQPGTYVRPHYHPEQDKWELFTCIKGTAIMAIFSADGVLLNRIILCAEGPVYAVEVPPLAWHSITAIQTDTVLLEVKQGPYISNSDKNFADWAPDEGAAQCAAFVEWFITGVIGSTAPGGLL